MVANYWTMRLTFALGWLCLVLSACGDSGGTGAGDNGGGPAEGTTIQSGHDLAVAIAQLQPGQTLTVPLGTYVIGNDEDILRPPSGTAAAPITIRGAGARQGSRPLIVGRDNVGALLQLLGVDHLRIENLEFTHDPTATGEAAWARDGIQMVDGLCEDIMLSGIDVHHLDEFAINAQDVDGLVIDDCRLEYCGYGGVGGPAGQHGGWQNVILRTCTLAYAGHYWQGGDGSDRPYDRPDGLGSEASAGPLMIEDSYALHNYGDGFDSKCANTTVSRCVAANNSCDGVKLWGDGSRIENSLIYGRGDGNPEPTNWSAVVLHGETAGAVFTILNCTIDDALGRNYVLGLNYDAPNVPVQLVLRNNIFSSRGPSAPLFISPATTLTADHNLFWLPQSEELLDQGGVTTPAGEVSTLGPGNGVGEPLFVQPAWGQNGDYHLQAGSPARDSGTVAEAPAIDLDGTTRPQGAGVDLGVYEE